MSSSEFDNFPAPTLAPTTDVPLSPAEQFEFLQRDLSSFPTAVDLVVAADAPAPIGRSWSFDWVTHRFVKLQGMLGPKQTYGLETLTEWIEKALHTARGAHPVHPDGYGLAQTAGLLFGAPVGTVPPGFEDSIRSALTFHPAILDVTDFSYAFDPDDEALLFSATVVLTSNQALQLQDVRLSQSLAQTV